ncbi:type III secretion system protein [Burkholderia multivorans]|uniref:type III secretion system protein n=1 Tax=Burkholderia ubonensis TaxID=101571 RepID=UPI000F6B52FC|nr:type III secretion system protein [Burkholderia ubonensis]AYZ62920.1 type III secretion system protein [Burkholderia multivorans]VWC38405.1 type III secretion protein [Burkholderia ubonensis]
MSRVTRAIAHTIHAAKPDPRRRRPVRARTATTYGKYGTRFTYSNGFQANAAAARNQMLAKLKPRLKTAVAGSLRRRRAESQEESFDGGDEAAASHAHVAPHDEHDRHSGGQGGGRQQRDQDERDDEPAGVSALPRVRARPTAAPAPEQRALRDIAHTLADAAQREQALRHLWADTLLQLGRRVDADPAARITPALLNHNADLLAARLRSGPWMPIGWSGVKQVLLDAMQSAGAAPRDASAARGERASTHYLLLPLLVFNAERPSTNAQLARAIASVGTLHGGVSAASRPRS